MIGREICRLYTTADAELQFHPLKGVRLLSKLTQGSDSSTTTNFVPQTFEHSTIINGTNIRVRSVFSNQTTLDKALENIIRRKMSNQQEAAANQ